MSILEERLTKEEQERLIQRIESGMESFVSHAGTVSEDLDRIAKEVRKHFRECDCICELDLYLGDLKELVAAERALGLKSNITSLAIVGYVTLISKVCEGGQE